MALPWLRVLDVAIGVSDLLMLRKARRRGADAGADADEADRALDRLDNRLAGVAVAALKELSEQNRRRLEFEREQADEARVQAERTLRQELRRQAVDREIARLRVIAGLAVASWLGTLFVTPRIIGGGDAARLLVGTGWVALLAALASALSGQSRAARRAARYAERDEPTSSADRGALAAGLLVAGLALLGLAALIS